EYAIMGDVNIGVLHIGLRKGEGGSHCSLSTGNPASGALQSCEKAKFALDEVNANPHVLPNISLGMVCVDTCSSSQTALGRSMYLVEDHSRDCETTDDDGFVNHKIVGALGPTYSSVAVSISGFFSLYSIPILGTYATADELSNKEKHEYFLRLVPPDRFQAQLIVDVLQAFNWTYVGVFYSEGAYGEEGAKYIQKLLKDTEICIAFSEVLMTSKGENEINEIVDVVNTYKLVTVSIWFVDRAVFRRVAQGLQDSKVSINHVKLFSDSATFEVKAGNTFPNFTKGGLAVGFKVLEIPGFRDYMNNLIPGKNSDNPWLEKLWEQKYGCNTHHNSSNACSKYPAPRNSYGDLTMFRNFYIGMHVYAQALHRLVTKNCLKAFHNSALLNGCFEGKELLDMLISTEFNVINENVAFDEKGDRRGQYVVYHYSVTSKNEFQAEPVMLWDEMEPVVDISADQRSLFVPRSQCSKECNKRQFIIQKSPHCCWECRSCRSNEVLARNRTTCNACPAFFWPNQDTLEFCKPIVHKYIRWSDLSAVSLLVSSFFGASISGSFIGIFIQKRKTRLVKSSNKKMTFLLLFGTILSFMLTLLFVAKPSKIICFLRDVGFNLVFTFLFAPLLVKTSTIYFIFDSGLKGKRRPSFVSKQGQNICLIFILFAVQIVSPSHAVLRMPGQFEPRVELLCAQATIPFLMPLSYNILLIVLCGILGYRCRKLPENFNESGFIFVAAWTTIFTWVLFIPTYFTATSSLHQAILLNLSLLLNAFITIGCLFAPKVYALYYVSENRI
ncbi:hypothetical protein CAPTEDRAFT_32869, partial [Capitella teleta]